jgi:hypothetical protein
MIITRLIGGLGNQLFQYAAGMSLARFHQVELKLDISGYSNYLLHGYSLQYFEISAKIATNDELEGHLKNNYLLNKFNEYTCFLDLFGIKKKQQIEKSFAYDHNFYLFPKHSYLQGYWQSEKYFLPIKKNLKKEFTLKDSIINNNSHFLPGISSSNSVSVHIRRGDYFSNLTTNKIHGILPIEYYIRSVNYINSVEKNLLFYIFSDDIDWCKKNLKLNCDFVIVESFNSNFIDDFRLMSLCKHNIIANSTFSWWAAWLNANPNKIVIAPKMWFRTKERNSNDIIPSNWIVLN